MLLGALALAAGSASTASAATRAATPTVAAGVSVDGAHLERDGVPWLPRGVQIVGLVAPQGSLSGKYVAANAHFGAAELQAAKAAGADTVRIQVSQFGLDPDDPLYSSAYVQQVWSGVELARELGLVVIVSLQAQPPAGRAGGCPLPDLGAERVWNALAPLFSGDPGVMFELYNEPSLAATPANWQLWEYGGAWLQKDGNVCQEVGVQTLIDEIRGAGASNVIIVPGLDAEATLAGMPALSDPSNPSNPQLAYGIHYPSLAVGSGQWETKFGRFSASAPVIVTEWYDSSIHDCVTDERARVAWLLDYLANKEIGVVGFAFDVPGTIVADWSYAPTTYSNFSCGVAGDGPGQLLFGEFAGLQQAADGPTQADPAWVISYSTVRRLARSAPGLAHHFFDTPRTFVTGSSAASLRSLGLPAAIPTASFESETALASAIERRKLPADTGAVLYDDQHGRQTPRAQQLRPALYYRRAAQVAHAHGLMLIAAPAPDLVRALAPKTPTADTDAEFLKLGIPGAVARSADVYDVQAQSTEANRAKYTAFVRAAGAQAATAHPDLELISGISTTFNGRAQAPAELANTVLASQSVVSGYWLSDPARAKPCASCKVPYARLVPAFLRLLSSHGV